MIKIAKSKISIETQIVLIGNKLGYNGNRQVTYEEGKNLSEKYDMLFYEVDENNCQYVFCDIAKSVANKMEELNQ